MADEAYVLSLYREYCSNPNCDHKPFDQWKSENATLIMLSSARKKSSSSGGGKGQSPIMGVYEGTPAAPPGPSYGIPTSSKAPAPAPAPMAATKCPYCHHHDGDAAEGGGEGTLQTEGPFSKIKSLVSSATGSKLSLSNQLIEMVKALLAFKDREPAKMESDRQAYFADIRRALETEIMRKKRLSQQQAGSLIETWGTRWAYLWNAYVVRSRESYRSVRIEGKVSGGKKEFSANDIASAVNSILDATVKGTGDSSINELELASSMLVNMVEIARRTGYDGIDLLVGVFGTEQQPQQEQPPMEESKAGKKKYDHMGRMFGASMRAHLGNEKARMAATAFKRGVERAMLASAADMDDVADAAAEEEKPTENSELAEFIETRASLLGLSADESYYVLLPDASVEPGLKARIEAMPADVAARFVQAHAAPTSSLSTDGSGGSSQLQTRDGKRYVLVQLDSEPAMIYDVDPATGARRDETGAAQIGPALQKNNGRLFFIFFRRTFVRPDSIAMTQTSAHKLDAPRSHSQIHRDLASVSSLSTFAKLAHETGLDQQLASGAHTVFAPKNSVFTKELLAKLPKDKEGQLRILQNHVLHGSLTRASELNGRRQTAAGNELVFDAARGTINGNVHYKLEKRFPHLVVYEIDNVLL